MVAVQSASGSFAPVDPFLSLGSILDITDDPTPPAPYTYVPSGGPVVVPNFLDFSDPWLYTLTSVETQTCTPSATQFCTGMFKLVQVGSSVSVNMAMRGFITAGADDTPFTLLITGNFANTNIGAVLAAATTRTGMFSHSWSGELTASPIPEPGTVAMGFLGIVGVGVGRIFTRRLSR